MDQSDIVFTFFLLKKKEIIHTQCKGMEMLCCHVRKNNPHQSLITLHIHAANPILLHPECTLLNSNQVSEEATEIHWSHCQVHGTSSSQLVFLSHGALSCWEYPLDDGGHEDKNVVDNNTMLDWYQEAECLPTKHSPRHYTAIASLNTNRG